MERVYFFLVLKEVLRTIFIKLINLEEVKKQRLCIKTLFREVKGKGSQLKTMLLLEKVANHCQGGALQCSAV